MPVRTSQPGVAGDIMSAHLWKDIVDQVPLGAVVASRSIEGRIEFVNREFSLLTGYVLSDVPTVVDWIRLAYPDPEYRKAVLENWSNDVSPEQMRRNVSYDVVCKDGSKKRLLLRASLLDDEYMVVTLLDVTRQYEAEQALRTSEHRYRTLVESCPVPISLNRGMTIVFVNTAAVVLLGGKSAQDIIGQPATNFTHPDCLETIGKSFAELERNGSFDRVSCKLVRFDGAMVEVEVTGVVMEFDGKPTNQLAIQDVTARNEAERNRRNYEEKLQQAQRVESLGMLAAGVAHDFNNILVGILGSASLAVASKPEGPVNRHLERIESSARRAAELASQMLACSGQVFPELEVVDLNLLLMEMKPLLGAVARDTIQVNVQLSDAPQAVSANPTQVRQILLNLVANAAEAMQGEGTQRPGCAVDISLQSHVQDPQPTASASTETLEEGRYVVLRVADNGPGMLQSTLERIFEPFFTTRFAGRGLGLAAVHGIVRAHKGKISVDSRVGEGSTFSVYFRSADQGCQDTPPPEAEGGPCHGRVLLVDDEEIVREVAIRMLEALGYSATAAASGAEALEVMRRAPHALDLVIVDLNMPDADGLAVRKWVREICGDIPVVLSSGFGEQEVTQHLSENGFSGFLKKPFDLGSLEDAIAVALRKECKS